MQHCTKHACRRCTRNTRVRRSESGRLEWVVNSPAVLRVRKLAIHNSCFATPASVLGSSWRKIRTARTIEQDTSSEREFRYRSPWTPTKSGAWEDRMGCVRSMFWDYGIQDYEFFFILEFCISELWSIRIIKFQDFNSFRIVIIRVFDI